MRTWGRATAVASILAVLPLTGCSGSDSSAPNSTGGSGASKGAGTGGSSSAAPTSVAPPKPVTGHPGSVTIGASGDLIAHPSIVRMARQAAGGTGYRFDQFFTQMTSLVSANDVSICQMENPLSADDTNLARELSFNAPHEFATSTKALGFDGCSTANNHTFDRGVAGMVSTRKVMAANGLKAAGPGASADESGQPVFYEAKGFKVAQLSYTYTINNLIGDDLSVPAKAPWTGSAMWARRKAVGIEQDAAAARAKGADLVLVSLHWGQEYKPVTSTQKELAKALLTSGQVDWIIGNHPHIVQPCAKIDGRYVNYALGNFFSGQQAAYLPGTADGAFASVTFTRDDAGKITQQMTYQPTYQDQKTRVVAPATSTSNAASRAKTVAIMGAFGCDAKAAN